MTATAIARFDDFERRTWAGRARAYEDTFGKVCAHPVPRLLDLTRVRPGDRVLDVGCGTGAVARAALARAAKVTAVDADPGMLELAGRTSPELELREAALPELPFAGGTFDVAVGNFVLNHVGDPLAALAELRRVTRPGGRLAFTVWPTPPAPGAALLGRALQAAGASRPPELPTLGEEQDFPRTRDGLRSLLEAAGLVNAACERVSWEHRTTVGEWWSGPAAGIASVGQCVVRQPPEVFAETRRQFEALSVEFRTGEGELALPHTALLGYASR